MGFGPSELVVIFLLILAFFSPTLFRKISLYYLSIRIRDKLEEMFSHLEYEANKARQSSNFIKPNEDELITYHRLLEVDSEASCGEIKKAWRRRAFQVHPDRNKERSEWANEEMKKANQALEELLKACD